MLVGQVTIGFVEAATTVSEGDGSINIPVSLGQEVAVPVTVSFQIISGTAMEGPSRGECNT